MTIYNVAATVVELITADSGAEAVRTLESKLRTAGFEVLEHTGNAFESEDQ